jgi:hypothetical protein
VIGFLMDVMLEAEAGPPEPASASTEQPLLASRNVPGINFRHTWRFEPRAVEEYIRAHGGSLTVVIRRT